MILADPPEGEPIRWVRNGLEFSFSPDRTLGDVRRRIARAHAFDDMHGATGYSPSRLCYVTLKGAAEAA
jgi:hypothetical protein